MSNSILAEKREVVEYVGILQTKILNRKPILLVNDGTGSTVKFNPNKHKMNSADLHKLEQDVHKLPSSELIKMLIGR